MYYRRVAQILFAKKKERTLMLCTDYKELSMITIKINILCNAPNLKVTYFTFKLL